MKIIYSELKKFLPNLTQDYKQLRDDLTLIGHFASGYQEIDGQHIYDLEVRQNRGDCQSYYGVALDLSVFYQIPFVIPTFVPSGAISFSLSIFLEILFATAIAPFSSHSGRIIVNSSPRLIKERCTFFYCLINSTMKRVRSCSVL